MAAMDFLRRGLGVPTEDDRQKARDELKAMSLKHTPGERLAVAMADLAVGSRPGERKPLPDGLVRIMLPELANDARPLPQDHDQRRLAIARAVVRTVDRHLEQGSDSGLGKDLGRAVRLEAVRNTHAPGVMVGSLEDTLAKRTERQGMEVASFLSHGDAVERQHAVHIKAIPQRGEVHKTVERLRGVIPTTQRVPPSGPELGAWVDKGLRIERAMARAGLMEPQAIVRSAHAVMREAPVETLSREPRARPDFSAPKPTTPEARRDAITRWMTAPGRTTPVAATQEARQDAERDVVPARNPAMQAAMAASQGRAM